MIDGSNIGSLNVKIGADYAEAEAAFNNVKKGMQEVKEEGKSLDGLTDLALLATAAAAANAVKFLTDQMGQMINAAIQFESAMAGVAKTTDMSSDELNEYGQALMEMSESIPLTTSQLASISEMAGQLGISGKRNLLDFTQTMAKLGTATNMTSEQAATMLAQFANITNMDTSNYGRLGSTIVALGNNFATTESKITQMAQGMAAVATNAGISEAEIMALAAAASSIGMEAQAGATSWSKLIQEMQTAVETGKDLDKWAYASGMTAGEFKQAWGRNATEAINAFVTGLKRHNDEGRSMTTILNDLGITEVRQSKLVQSLANAGDLLTRTIQTGNAAWEDNNALNREAATRFQTTESKMQLVRNRMDNINTTLGSQMLPVFNVLLDVVNGVTKSFEEFVEENEWVGSVIIGVSAGLITLVGATIALTIAEGTATGATGALAAAMAALAATLEAHPVIMLIAGLVALGMTLFSMAASAAQASEQMEALRDSSDAAAEEVEKVGHKFEEALSAVEADAQLTDILIDRVETLGKKTNRTAQEQWLLEDAISRLNEMYPDLALSIDDVNDGLSDHAKNVIEAAKAEAKAKAIQDQLVELYRQRSEAQGRIREATVNQQRAQDALTQSDREWLNELEALKIVYGEYYEQTDEYIALVGRMPEAVRKMNVENMAADDIISQETATIAELDEQIGYITDTYEESSGVVNQYASDTDGLTKSERELVAATDESANQITAAMQQLSVEYETARQTALNNIQSQINGWNELHENSDVTVEGMIKGYQSQIDYMKNYTNNMRSLLDRNIEGLDEYVKAIDNGSVDTAGAYAAMAKASDDELREMVRTYQERQGQMDQYGQDVAGMQVDYDQRMRDMITSTTVMVNGLNQYDEAYQAASKTMFGVVDAADNMVNTVSGRYRYLMYNAVQQLKSQIRLKVSYSSSGDSATVSAEGSLPHRDKGGYFDKAHVALIAEKRPEFVGAAEDLETFINQSVNKAFNLSLPTLPEIKSGNSNVTVNVPISVSKELSESEINRKAKQISQVVSKEFAMATGGRL